LESDASYRARILLSRSLLEGVYTPDQVWLAALSVPGNTRVFVVRPDSAGSGIPGVAGFQPEQFARLRAALVAHAGDQRAHRRGSVLPLPLRRAHPDADVRWCVDRQSYVDVPVALAQQPIRVAGRRRR
jgi:hypothetical protein